MPPGASLLEIGLGTNDETIVSTMGRFARPGASLRAFRDFLPASNVFGADIDRSILFNEERITTFWVDQTSDESLRALEARIPDDVHLIIDDGMDSPDANVQVLMLGLRLLPVDGCLVIEDITPGRSGLLACGRCPSARPLRGDTRPRKGWRSFRRPQNLVTQAWAHAVLVDRDVTLAGSNETPREEACRY